MSKAAIFIGVGFEEIEVITTVDVLRRGGMDVDLITVSGNEDVEGAHQIHVKCDRLFYNVDYTEYDILILPGGPGIENLKKHEGLMNLIPSFYNDGKKIAAICAAPSILGELGLLEGVTAVCYPGYEDRLIGANVGYLPVVMDGRIITAKSAGYAMDFGLEILKWFIEEEAIRELKNSMY